jgi:membrane fusion protein (multidrug efflux system)
MLICGIVWVCARFVHLGRVEYTDNAQVKQQIVPVNSRVQGFIKKIYFEEYQDVKKGDTLVVIDDAEYRYRVAQAQAAHSAQTVTCVAVQTVTSETMFFCAKLC